MKGSTKLLAAATAGAAGTALYAALVEPFWLELRRTAIHVRGLPAALEGFRIGLLTDLHAAGRPSLARARRAVALLCRTKPDLIALTGDFVNDHAGGFDHVFDALAPLRAPYGVYAVPGNHDHVVGIDAWRRTVARRRTVVDLTNRAVVLDVSGARLCIAGVDDYYRVAPRLELPLLHERDVTILLAHSPDQAERSRRALDSVDLVLSGHTHAGQIRLPFLGAPVNSAEHEDLYEEGVRRRPWTQVYTSRGVGTVGLPFRFLARPEVTLLTLTGRPRPPR